MSPPERPQAQRIQHGCPKDQGDLLFDSTVPAFICEVCGYSQPGVRAGPEAFITTTPRAGPTTAPGPTVAELAQRWGLTVSGAIYRIRHQSSLPDALGSATRIPASIVAQIEKSVADTGAPFARALVVAPPPAPNGAPSRPPPPRRPKPVLASAPLSLDLVERRLANGTLVTVTVVGSLLTLSRTDRDWLYELVDLIREAEATP